MSTSISTPAAMSQLGVLAPVLYLLYKRPYPTSLFSLVRDGPNPFQRLEGISLLRALTLIANSLPVSGLSPKTMGQHRTTIRDKHLNQYPRTPLDEFESLCFRVWRPARVGRQNTSAESPSHKASRPMALFAGLGRRPARISYHQLVSQVLCSSTSRNGPEFPKFVFISVCFETHGHTQSIPQSVTSSVGSPPT